jgi:hypothetical protein
MGGNSVEENWAKVAVPPLKLALLYGASVMLLSCHATPKMVIELFPMFWMTAEPVRPLTASALPKTKPPKSTSAGDMSRKGLALTRFPVREMGTVVVYPVTPLVVRMLSTLPSTPGMTRP